MFWDNNKLTVAIAKLNESYTVFDACIKLAKEYGDIVTSDALRRAFSRHGLKNPKSYLKNMSVTDISMDFKVPGTSADVTHVGPSIFGSQSSYSDFYWKPYSYDYGEFRLGGAVSPGVCKVKHTEPEKKQVTKIMVAPDIHIPNENKVAWGVFIKALEAVQPDILVTIGDFMDLESVSAHPKSPKDESRLLPEIVAGRKALDAIRAVFKRRFVFLAGNHCSRFERYIAAKSPELDELLTLKSLLQLEEKNIEYYPYGEIVKIGKMNFVHDLGRCGVNAVRQTLSDINDNVCFGHSHRAAIAYSGTVTGETHVGMNVGWLGDYDAISYTNKHKAKKDWQHSFGLIYQDLEGVSYCNLVPIINGKCIVDGKFIEFNG